MDRRTFIGSAIAASIVPIMGLNAGNPITAFLDENLKYRIIAAAPNQTVEGTRTAMTSFINIRQASTDDNQYVMEVESFTIDQEETFVLDDIFPTEVHEISYEYDKPEVSYIVKAANTIAKQTRRGMGNHYAVLSDHTLVWYQGRSEMDAPIINMGKNAFKHPKQNDYFVRIRDLILTDEHHEQLRSLGYKRIT